MIPSFHSPAQAYVQNALRALQQQQPEYAALLLAHLCRQLDSSVSPVPGWSYGVGLDTGLMRKRNEDYPFALANCALTREPFGLFIVADGIGGHEDGQEAAMLAVHGLVDFLLVACEEHPLTTPGALYALLQEGVQHANWLVYQRNQERIMQTQAAGRALMGTTLTMALCSGNNALVANAGDSRTYLFRDHMLHQITRDHSTVALLIADKLLEPDAVYTHPRRNEIYRSLGEKAEVEIDFFSLSLQPGDILLLCSDGLWEMVRQPVEIATVLSSALSCAEQVQQLVQLAYQGGGKDNISCVVAKFEPVVSPFPPVVDAPTLVLPRSV